MSRDPENEMSSPVILANIDVLVSAAGLDEIREDFFKAGDTDRGRMVKAVWDKEPFLPRPEYEQVKEYYGAE